MDRKWVKKVEWCSDKEMRRYQRGSNTCRYDEDLLGFAQTNKSSTALHVTNQLSSLSISSMKLSTPRPW